VKFYEHTVVSTATALAVVSVVAIAVYRELTARLAGSIATSLNGGFRRRVTSYPRRYRGFLRRVHAVLEGADLYRKDPKKLGLIDVFVDLFIVSSGPGNATSGVVGRGVVGTVPVKEQQILNRLIGQRKPIQLMLVGGPGYGKSTLLQHVVLTVVNRRKPAWLQRRPYPVLLRLREHATRIGGDADVTLAELVATASGPSLTAPDGWWAWKLRRGRCVVMFDGMDEIPDPTMRNRCQNWILRESAAAPGNDYVVTSRPEVRLGSVDGFNSHVIQPLNEQQIQTFIHRWYTVIYERSESADPRKITDRSDDLFRRLHRSRALIHFASNPLLLTMIANVHERFGELPENRTELYAQMFKILLDQRPRQRGTEETGTPIDVKLQALTGVAMEMSLSRNFRLSEVRIKQNFGKVQDVLADTLFEDLTYNGVLVHEGGREYGFAHRSMQEYLTAKGFADGDDALLRHTLGDIWWINTVRFYSELAAAPEAVVEWCLNDGSQEALAVAFACVDGLGRLSPITKDRLQKLLLLAGNRSPEVESQRRRVARALAVEHMSDIVAAPGGVGICLHPVRWWLYRFFLDDRRRPAPLGGQLPPLQASNEVVFGLWRSDAEDFVIWLNDLLRESELPECGLLDASTAASFHAKVALSAASGKAELSTWIGAPAATHPLLPNPVHVTQQQAAEILADAPAFGSMMTFVLLQMTYFSVRQLLASTPTSRGGRSESLSNGWSQTFMAERLLSLASTLVTDRARDKKLQPLRLHLGAIRDRIETVQNADAGLSNCEKSMSTLRQRIREIDRELNKINSSLGVIGGARTGGEQRRQLKGRQAELRQASARVKNDLDGQSLEVPRLKRRRDEALSAITESAALLEADVEMLEDTVRTALEHGVWIVDSAQDPSHILGASNRHDMSKPPDLFQAAINPAIFDLSRSKKTWSLLEFAKGILSESGFEQYSVIDLDATREQMLSQDRSGVPPDWRRAFHAALMREVGPALRREQPARKDRVSHVLVAALCLAHSVSRRKEEADIYRRMGTGYMLLAIRQSGIIPTNEVLLLGGVNR
jgi:hypothetical protein